MYSKFWIKVTDILRSSLFGRIYLWIVHAISGAFRNSWFYSFFVSHNMADYGESSKIAGFVRKTFFKSKFTEFVSQSQIVRLVYDIPERVLSAPIYVLSFYMIPSGILLFMRYFGNINYMIVFALVIVVGFIMLGFKANLGDLIGNSFVLGKITSFFEIKTDYEKSNTPYRICLIALIAGIVTGGATFVFGDTLSLVAFVGMMFLPMLLASPLLLLILTFLSGIMLSTLPATMLSVVTFLIVLCRMFYGKEKLPKMRVVYILVALYAVLTCYYAFNGFGGSDSALAGIIQFSLLIFFFSVVVVINNYERFRKMVFAISVCSLYTGFLGILQRLSGQGGTGWSNDENYVGGLQRISATFLNPNVYGEFLIFAICVGIAALLLSNNFKQRLLFLFCIGVQLINLAFTYSRGCYIAVVLAVLIIIWCLDKRLFGFGFFAAPALPYVLPQNVLTRVLSIASSLKDTSVTYRFTIWRSSMKIIKNHWFIGSGIGTVAFTSFYQNYMFRGTPAQHSHNFLMQITIELSIVGTVLMLLILLFAIKDVCNVVKFNTDIRVRFMVIPLIASFAGIMLEGMVDYIFYNNIVYMVFWMVMALLVAGLNICDVQPQTALQSEKEI